jgi:hypothetical protein
LAGVGNNWQAKAVAVKPRAESCWTGGRLGPLRLDRIDLLRLEFRLFLIDTGNDSILSGFGMAARAYWWSLKSAMSFSAY